MNILRKPEWIWSRKNENYNYVGDHFVLNLSKLPPWIRRLAWLQRTDTFSLVITGGQRTTPLMSGLPSSPEKDTPCACVYYLYICLYNTTLHCATYGARIGRGREPSISTGGKSTQVAGPEASRVVQMWQLFALSSVSGLASLWRFCFTSIGRLRRR